MSRDHFHSKKSEKMWRLLSGFTANVASNVFGARTLHCGPDRGQRRLTRVYECLLDRRLLDRRLMDRRLLDRRLQPTEQENDGQKQRLAC